MKNAPHFFFKVLLLWLLFANLGFSEETKDIKFQVERFLVEGEAPVDQRGIDRILDSFQHKEHDLKSLQDVAKTLEKEIRKQGYAFFRVILPPQILDDGIVSLKIISFNLSAIEVEGSHYFNRENILTSLPILKLNHSPNTRSMLEYLKVANRHPSKRLKLVFREGEIEDTIIAKVEVTEQKPYSISIIANNSGTPSTGEFRLTTALHHTNLWNLDHMVHASYTTSPDHFDTVQQYGGSYSLPIYPLKGWLTAHYAYSDVDTGVVAGDFNVSGSGEMYGIHYLQYLPRIGRYEHWLDLGIDNRFFVDDVTFLGADIGSNVRSTPFGIMYKGEYPWTYVRLGFHFQWVKNIDFGGHNTQKHYQISRFSAEQSWDVYRYGAFSEINLAGSGWLARVQFNAQHSDEPLIVGEQIGLGGSYTVRGYNERETSADSGEIVKFELYTPRWKGFNLLAFYDYGHGQRLQALPGEAESWAIDSVGAGMRWQWKKNVLLSVDLAHTLQESITTNAGTNRLHASLVLRY